MANDVVVPANQLLAAESADRDEFLVRVGDCSFQISAGNKQSPWGQVDFRLRDWQIDFHELSEWVTGGPAEAGRVPIL